MISLIIKRRLIAHHRTITVSQSMSHSESQKSTSVFHALGSYADRIKEPNSSKPSRLERSQTSPTKNTMASARDVVEDDGEGSWETVRVGRNKARPERLDEKRGSSSRNWREREEKSDAVKEDKEASAPSQPAKSDFPPVSSVASRPKSADPAPATATPSASATPRSAWGATLPASSASAPPTATVNGTAAPQPVDAVSSSPQKQAPRKSSADAEAEGSWRARPNVSAPEVVASSAPPKAALPPAVNAWSLRKPVVPAAAVSTPTPAQAASAAPSAKAVESSPAAHANGEASASKKTKKKAEPPSVADSTLWPDVNQATKADDAKAKHEKNGAESADETAHGVSTGSECLPRRPLTNAEKQKWKAIPATELQEAADKVAETSRRQAKQKQKQAKGETDSVDSKRSQGKKQSSESKKAPRMQRSASQGSLRSHGEGQRPNGANGDVGANGSAHSRQGAQGGSKRSSPSHSHMPLSPDQGVREVSSTGTLPQQGFNPASNLPRPPRGRDRDGRGGYAPRGRGSYRAASTAAMHRMYGGDLSPLGANASLYPAAYGVGYGGFYPVPAPSYVLAPGFDASQGTYNGVPVFPRGMPPPPMPVTQVANIDPQRFYVLGQVSWLVDNLTPGGVLLQHAEPRHGLFPAPAGGCDHRRRLTADGR